MKSIRVDEINGLWSYLGSIDWSESWFKLLGLFHLTCVVLTVVSRKNGVFQTIYFGVLLLLVYFAEQINEWAARNYRLFAHQQYFDSPGLFLSLVFSVPILIHCLIIVVMWLWDVCTLITDVKTLKFKQEARRQKSKQEEKNK